jgi:hypothetical protein
MTPHRETKTVYQDSSQKKFGPAGFLELAEMITGKNFIHLQDNLDYLELCKKIATLTESFREEDLALQIKYRRMLRDEIKHRFSTLIAYFEPAFGSDPSICEEDADEDKIGKIVTSLKCEENIFNALLVEEVALRDMPKEQQIRALHYQCDDYKRKIAEFYSRKLAEVPARSKETVAKEWNDVVSKLELQYRRKSLRIHNESISSIKPYSETQTNFHNTSFSRKHELETSFSVMEKPGTRAHQSFECPVAPENQLNERAPFKEQTPYFINNTKAQSREKYYKNEDDKKITKKIEEEFNAAAQRSTVLPAGTAFLWGSSRDGRLGLGQSSDPLQLAPLKDFQFLTVHCGYHHTCAISKEGKVFSWGKGSHGQLGHGTSDSLLFPKIIPKLSPYHVIQVTCGWQHTMALTDEGQLFSWVKPLEYDQHELRETEKKDSWAIMNMMMCTLHAGLSSSGNWH